MHSKGKESFIAIGVFILGMSWALIPNRQYFIDSVSYMSLLAYAQMVDIVSPYHPLFPMLWKGLWSSREIMGDPAGVLRTGSLMISIFGGLGIWATFRWGRISGLSVLESLLCAAALAGLGAWSYFSTQWMCYIPSVALMLTALFISMGGGGASSKQAEPFSLFVSGAALGLAMAFHVLAAFAIPALVFILWRSGGGIKRALSFIGGLGLLIIMAWGFGAYQIYWIKGILDLFTWLTSSYGAEPRFFGPFNYLVILQATLIGNAKVLFTGIFDTVFHPGLFERISTHQNSGVLNYLETAGFIMAISGIALFIIGLALHSKHRQTDRQTETSNSSRRVLPGLFVSWLFLAAYSSIYVMFHAHYRLFAVAVFWWMMIVIIGTYTKSTGRRFIKYALVLMVIGLWSYNIIVGPARWWREETNPYLVEAEMVLDESSGYAPAILESSITGFARTQYLVLFRRQAYAEMTDKLRGKRLDMLLKGLDEFGALWVSDEALKEMNYLIDASGDISGSSESRTFRGLSLAGLKAKSFIESPLGKLYLVDVPEYRLPR